MEETEKRKTTKREREKENKGKNKCTDIDFSLHIYQSNKMLFILDRIYRNTKKDFNI